jgi:hypothetical protein
MIMIIQLPYVYVIIYIVWTYYISVMDVYMASKQDLRTFHTNKTLDAISMNTTNNIYVLCFFSLIGKYPLIKTLVFTKGWWKFLTNEKSINL